LGGLEIALEDAKRNSERDIALKCRKNEKINEKI
jgi:hypothetical protein